MRRYMLSFVSLILFLCLGVSLGTAQQTVVFPGATWQTRTPAEVGLDAAKINQFILNLGVGTYSSGVIIRDGYLVASWGDSTTQIDWASAAKPVHSTLLLFALQEGRIASVDDPIGNWGWSMQSADANLSFRHLANNISGYARAETPGAAWAYNDYAITLYVKTLERVFGSTLANAAATRFAPLQLQDGTLYGSRSGYGVFTSPRDFARIGWLWLNRGNWNGQQLLPTAYFNTYMNAQVPGNLPRTTASSADYLGVGTVGGGSNQSAYGPGIYGFNWWFNGAVGTTGNLTWPDAPLDTFQANGHWNVEVMTIIPSLRMVVAAKGNWGTFAPGDRNAGMNQNLRLLAEAALPAAPTLTASPQPTAQVSSTPTSTRTNTATVVPTSTPTATLTRTSTATAQFSSTPTSTRTSTATFTPTTTATVVPTSTPTATSASSYPRSLPSTHPQISFVELQAPSGALRYIRAETSITTRVTNAAWYVNGTLVNTERSAPYSLGGDSNGVIHGYAITQSPSVVRVMFTFSDATTAVGETTVYPTSVTATPIPTSTPTIPVSTTPSITPTSTPTTLPSATPSFTPTSTRTFTATFTRTHTATVLPTSTPTVTSSSGYPRSLPSTNPQISFVELQAPSGGLMYIRAETTITTGVTNAAWYVNGMLVNTERSAPYSLGGDSNGVIYGYAITQSPSVVRVMFTFNNGTTAVGETTIYLTGSMANAIPTSTPTTPPSATPSFTSTTTPTFPPSATPSFTPSSPPTATETETPAPTPTDTPLPTEGGG